jgi:hypothetical protein
MAYCVCGESEGVASASQRTATQAVLTLAATSKQARTP